MKSSILSANTSNPTPIPEPKFRWATRVAVPVGILMAFGGLFAASVFSSFSPVMEVQTIPVVERPANKRAVTVNSQQYNQAIVQAAGWIEPNPFAVYAVALTNGSVEQVLFLEGDTVRKNDILARLIDDDALLELQRAEAEVRAAEEEWGANIEAKLEASVAAASVRETQASLSLARAELEVEQALSREAERIFARRKNLVGNGSIAAEEYESAMAASQAQAARVKVVEHRIEELEAKVDRMKAEEQAAQQRLKLRTEERRRLDLERVRLAEAQLRVERLEIKSPIDGVIMQRLVEPGSTLMTASDNAQMARVAELYDPKNLQVRVDIPLADAAKIGVGQPTQVVIEILPDQVFDGTVSRITNFADIQKNTLEVKVTLDNPAPELKPEMLARVRFFAQNQQGESREIAKGLSVFAPATALENDTAWVLSQFDGQEGIAIKRSVTTTGFEEDGWQEIQSGLQPGDLLITSSKEPLKPQQRVRVSQEGRN